MHSYAICGATWRTWGCCHSLANQISQASCFPDFVPSFHVWKLPAMRNYTVHGSTRHDCACRHSTAISCQASSFAYFLNKLALVPKWSLIYHHHHHHHPSEVYYWYAALPFVAAHGLIWVPPGYSYGQPMFGLDEVRGGSGWGSGTFAGPTGQRQPSEAELGQAEHQVDRQYRLWVSRALPSIRCCAWLSKWRHCSLHMYACNRTNKLNSRVTRCTHLIKSQDGGSTGLCWLGMQGQSCLCLALAGTHVNTAAIVIEGGPHAWVKLQLPLGPLITYQPVSTLQHLR